MVGKHREVSAETAEVLRSLRGVWDEEAVDELDHALLAAGYAAARHPGDDELVVAALLHDVAHSPLLAASGQPHDQVARDWLTPRFGPRVGWLAGAHVAAKRHLAQVDQAYADALSETSVRSLARQGGVAPVGPEWTRHPWWDAALELRRCDDAAKDPNAPVPELHWAIEVVDRLVGVPR
ncbi:HD family phosphohydrolase [Pseudonocardia spinosispora]|uniref:HD family phosphohydrolase n=1 Tax=Pseudonocardia spinosispora TaxID=103441 RepID=UPI00068575C3|nr:HD family phosphohydrolase [Pseudonocardia spinosispora]